MAPLTFLKLYKHSVTSNLSKITELSDYDTILKNAVAVEVKISTLHFREFMNLQLYFLQCSLLPLLPLLPLFFLKQIVGNVKKLEIFYYA